MIDLCFGNAMKGCLLWAKSFSEEAAVQTTDVVLFYEGEEAPSPEEQERAQRLFREQRERERRLWQDLYGPLDGGREELARQWRVLQRENAPLRVLEGGTVRSAPADYYDDRIRRVFPEKICKAAEVVVQAMVEQKVPHGDEFIGQRLRAFIDRGELRIAEEDKENFLRSLIERNTV